MKDDKLPNEHAVKKAKNYFKSCLAEGEIERMAKQEIESVINRLGSWPVGNATLWKSAWNQTVALLTFQQDFPGSSPLFQLHPDVDPYNSSKYILEVYSRQSLTALS